MCEYRNCNMADMKLFHDLKTSSFLYLDVWINSLYNTNRTFIASPQRMTKYNHFPAFCFEIFLPLIFPFHTSVH